MLIARDRRKISEKLNAEAEFMCLRVKKSKFAKQVSCENRTAIMARDRVVRGLSKNEYSFGTRKSCLVHGTYCHVPSYR